MEQFPATFYLAEKWSRELGRKGLVRNSFRWSIILYNLKKNGGKLGAHSVKILRENRMPIYSTKRVINGIKLSLVIKPDLFREMDGAVKRIWVKGSSGRRG